MDKIIPAFEVSLFDPSLSEVAKDMTELGIDSLLDDGMFKSIPIVSLLIGIGKTAQNIQDRNLLKQTVAFINAFNNRTIQRDKISKYRKKLKRNPKFSEDELGRVIILLNATIDLKRSEILAKLFNSYINEGIDWSGFKELSEINSRIFISDVRILIKVFKKEISNTSAIPVYKSERLISLGLLNASIQSVSISDTGNRTDKYIELSDIGELYCQFGLIWFRYSFKLRSDRILLFLYFIGILSYGRHLINLVWKPLLSDVFKKFV